jgi:hypothetical protein
MVALWIAFFVLGSAFGSTLAYRYVSKTAHQLMAKALDTQTPKDVIGLAQLVAKRMDMRFTALVVGNDASELLMAVAAPKNVAQSEELQWLAEALGDLHKSVSAQAAKKQTNHQTH